MEPVTHLLTGACLGRSGFNRKTAYATLAMTIAAEAPDLDMLWRVRGPIAPFAHHRGITHTLLGAPFVALAIVALLWAFDRLRKERAAARWGLLWLFAWIAVLSHIFLDWTTNYGVRPFFPFSGRWYSLDIVYMFEPVIFAALLLALVIPAILGLAEGEISGRKTRYCGRGWAVAALTLAAAVTVFRWGEHRRALDLISNLQFGGAPSLRSAAEPYPIDPFRWFFIVRGPGRYWTGRVETRSGEVSTDSGDEVFRPLITPAVTAAERSRLGRLYLDWAKFPVVTDRGAADTLSEGAWAPSPFDTVVEFRDLRFAYRTVFTFGASRRAPPLTAWVYVTPAGAVDAMVWNGKVRR